MIKILYMYVCVYVCVCVCVCVCVSAVLLTSFEVAMNDGKKLQNLEWKYLIVDEGHRLKNKDCRLLRELKVNRALN